MLKARLDGARAMVDVLTHDMNSDTTAGEQAYAFDDGRRFRATRQVGGGGKGQGGKGVNDGYGVKGLRNVPPGFKGGGGSCQTCNGTHPECAVCPTLDATGKDDWKGLEADPERVRPCVYNHLRTGKMCGGFGHQARHHLPCLRPEAKAAVQKMQAENGGKGKGGGKGKKQH